MSGTVHYTGRLVKIDKNGAESIEELAENLTIERHEQAFVRSAEKSALDFIRYKMSRKYYIDYESDEIYEIKDLDELEPDNDIYKAKRNGDNTISFEVRFYNYGNGMQWAIDKALANIKAEAETEETKSEDDTY